MSIQSQMGGFQLPPPQPWLAKLLMGLFGLYVLELVANAAGVPVYAFAAWSPMEGAFQVWQPLSHFFVQGASPQAVTSVLLSILVVYLLVPALPVERKVLAQATIAGVVGHISFAMAANLLGLVSFQPAMGWAPLVMVLPVLFGIRRPDDNLLLGFLFPIKGKWMLYGALVLALLYLLVERSLSTFGGLGVWSGVVFWWQFLGPGRRRRALQAKGAEIEKQLTKFTVIQGGRDNRPTDDEWVH